MKILFVVLSLFLNVHPSFGQSDRAIDSAANRLAGELTDLKNSADRLYAGNQALVTGNNELKVLLGKRQGQLAQLIDEGNNLTRASLKLQDINEARTNRIVQLEKAVFEIDSTDDHLVESLKKDKDEFDSRKQEDAFLSEQMMKLGISNPVPTVSGSGNYTKEKLRILKMVAQSKERQQIIYDQIANTQKQVSTAVVTVETSGDKEDLLVQISRLQAEIEQLGKMAQPQAVQRVWNVNELKQLDVQVKNLQKNHDELEDLVARMQQKAQKWSLSRDQMNEQAKLQSNFDEINKQNLRLRQDLNDYRQQMVELDKRKTYLESLLRK